eukprot:3936527-Rhodomonas_salina.1
MFMAARWAVRQLASSGQATECSVCGVSSRLHLWCVACAHSFCKACLKVQGRDLWSINFECVSCSIETVTVCVLDKFSRRENWLVSLAQNWLVTRSYAIKPSTWREYQRCMHQVIQFMRDTKCVVFQVLDSSMALGLCFFFQHLKAEGTSWATMAQHWSALANASRSAGLGN